PRPDPRVNYRVQTRFNETRDLRTNHEGGPDVHEARRLEAHVGSRGPAAVQERPQFRTRHGLLRAAEHAVRALVDGHRAHASGMPGINLFALSRGPSDLSRRRGGLLPDFGP